MLVIIETEKGITSGYVEDYVGIYADIGDLITVQAKDENGCPVEVKGKLIEKAE